MSNDKKLKVQKLMGTRIKQLRLSKGMSQQELASLCDYEKSNMARIESGNTNPTFFTLFKIAEALEVTLQELMNFDSLK